MQAAENGWVVTESVSQGRDEQEALANIKEAIYVWLWAEDWKAGRLLPLDRPTLLVMV